MNDRAWEDDIDLAFIPPLLRGAAERSVDYGVDLVAERSDRAIPRQTGQTAASQTRGRRGTRGHVAYQSRKAKALHDNLTVKHKRGRAKFLEQSLVSSAAAIRRRALAEFRAAINRGGGR